MKRSSGVSLTKPVDKVSAWLDHLSNLVAKAQVSPWAQNRLRDVLYRHYVIKPNEVPESYYDLQARIARERGHGDVTLNARQKSQLADAVIQDQKRSLDQWIEYLISKDTSMYPMWLKYWMFTGMTKLSKYDAQTGNFGNRTKETVAPFAELNREALAYLADAALKKLNKESLDEVSDPNFVKLLDGTSFGKLYGSRLHKIGVGRQGRFHTNEGKWIVYPKGSDHMPLVRSLDGKNTGWCTAGEATAKSQIAQGDFHVFYSLDSNGQLTIPRVAIRMEGNEIAEVRGVAKDQNLDEQISQSAVVATKLKEFGDEGQKFEKRDRDMKLLTEIENKARLDQELSKEELRFLYEIDSKIEGFGYKGDPRIGQIIANRDKYTDINVMFDGKFTREEISSTREEALSGKAKIHIGDLDLSDLKEAIGVKFPDTILGEFKISALEIAKDVTFPNQFHGDLFLLNLESAENVRFPEAIDGLLSLSKLKSAKNVMLPNTVNHDLPMHFLEIADGVRFPRTLNGTLGLSALRVAKAVEFPIKLDKDFTLLKLEYAENVKLPETIAGKLGLYDLRSAQGLILPDTINGDLYLGSLISASNLRQPIGVVKYYGPKDIQKATEATTHSFSQRIIRKVKVFLNGTRDQ
ncbi:MAG: hypothetical protein KDD22_05325 [Bdellovibrionales bacterium]|nr:hypothetical protein [Bdellovibrionales bacterium]